MSTRLDTISQLASRRNRVSSNARPTSPTAINKFDGTAKKPSVLERMKNITLSSHPTPPRQAKSSLARLAPGRVTRFGLVVRRIEAGQLDAPLDLGEDPALVKFVLGAFVRHELNQGLGNDHGTVVIEHDHVAREDRTTAAGDRLFPADEGQAVDRSRRGDARAPYRQLAGQHAGEVPHDAIGKQRRDITLLHACAQDIAEYYRAGHAHGVG